MDVTMPVRTEDDDSVRKVFRRQRDDVLQREGSKCFSKTSANRYSRKLSLASRVTVGVAVRRPATASADSCVGNRVTCMRTSGSSSAAYYATSRASVANQSLAVSTKP